MANLQHLSDYYPFGMLMPGRHSGTENYRYGLNGMEADNEVSGTGNHYTTPFRQYNPRLGRWMTTDPIVHVWQSPYAAFNDNPIWYSDPNGLEGDGGGAPPADGGGGKSKGGNGPLPELSGIILKEVVIQATPKSGWEKFITKINDLWKNKPPSPPEEPEAPPFDLDEWIKSTAESWGWTDPADKYAGDGEKKDGGMNNTTKKDNGDDGTRDYTDNDDTEQVDIDNFPSVWSSAHKSIGEFIQKIIEGQERGEGITEQFEDKEPSTPGGENEPALKNYTADEVVQKFTYHSTGNILNQVEGDSITTLLPNGDTLKQNVVNSWGGHESNGVWVNGKKQ